MLVSWAIDGSTAVVSSAPVVGVAESEMPPVPIEGVVPGARSVGRLRGRVADGRGRRGGVRWAKRKARGAIHALAAGADGQYEPER